MSIIGQNITGLAVKGHSDTSEYVYSVASEGGGEQGAGNRPPPQSQRLPNPKYCDCGEVSDQESRRV